MSKREIGVLAKILEDPQNEGRTAEEVAELCLEALTAYVKQVRADEVDRITQKIIESIDGERDGGIPVRVADALDRMKEKTHRLAIVGQISYGPQEPVQTVVLGPFRAPLTVTDEESFKAVTERPCADAREAGRDLAWDARTGRGRGRFQLVPAFAKAADAWAFYRASRPAQEIVAEVVDLIPKEIVPVCCCGLRTKPVCRFCGERMEHHCPLHERGVEPHRCRQPEAEAA